MKSVSIIIPLYNAEKFIENCFVQICSQTYNHSNIECIFVNDGSVDSSAIIVSNLISQNSTQISFRLVSHNHNQGVSAARNTGINHAHNDYVYFMDVDDTVMPNCIQYLVNALEIYPHADVVMGNILTKKNGLYHHNVSTVYVAKTKQQNLHDILLFIFAGYSPNKIVSREFLIKNKLYFPVGIPYFEDLYWNIDLAAYCNEIVYLPEVTYIYEDVGTSAMSTQGSKKELVAKCYWDLMEKGLTLNEPDNVIEIHLFIYSFIRNLLMIGNVKSVNRKDVNKVRRNLLKQSLKLGKLLLFLYDLQLYQPFLWISELRFFKNRSAKCRLWVCKKCQ